MQRAFVPADPLSNSMKPLLALLAAAHLFAAALPCPARAQDRPNIIWISAEDLSPRLGAYGDAVALTPNLDRLASEGSLFTRAFTTAGVCAPSRAAIITGMYQNSWGGHNMRTTHQGPGLPTPYHAVPPPYVKAFTEYLRAAGYFTSNDVKNDYQIGEPVTVWDENRRGAHWRSPLREEGQPFFSVFNFTTTHESQSWIEPGETTTTSPSDVVVPPYYPETPEVRRQIANHYDNIARMDEQAGEILRQLEEDGLADNTIVFFWGDHGDGLPRMKRWLYESGLLVPLIIRWPGEIEPGTVDDDLVSFVDLAPTVLALAGVPVPRHMQGQIFLGDEQAPAREYVYGARDRIDNVYDMVRAVRDRRYKYIRNYYPEKPYVQFVDYRNRSSIMQELFRLHSAGELNAAQRLWLRDMRPPEELYDVEADPHELDNLAGDATLGPVLARMRTAMDDWMADIDDQGHVPEDRMVRQMWMGDEQPVTSAPVFLRRSDTDLELEPVHDEPVEVVIHSGTHGASITYTTDEGDDAYWRLYSAPLRLVRGTTTLRARAVRYGYAESDETSVGVTVRAP